VNRETNESHESPSIACTAESGGTPRFGRADILVDERGPRIYGVDDSIIHVCRWYRPRALVDSIGVSDAGSAVMLRREITWPGLHSSPQGKLSRRIVDRINCVFASQLFDGASS